MIDGAVQPVKREARGTPPSSAQGFGEDAGLGRALGAT